MLIAESNGKDKVGRDQILMGLLDFFRLFLIYELYLEDKQGINKNITLLREWEIFELESSCTYSEG